ncbi:MAG: diadenylate cyclase CdaA [Armatimonadota bacterium]|nr:diadenylate cyclase CdaA [Armatimonadota bacterium]
MEQFWYQLTHLGTPALLQIVDVALVAYLLYRLLLMVRGSRAWRIIGGVVIYLALWFVTDLFELRTIHFLLEKGLVLGPVALVILLLPELRVAIEGFGKLGFWPERLGGGEEDVSATVIEEIVAAVNELASTQTGALIVIERSRKMPEIEANGVPLNARVSAPLLESLFYGENPLHDGAVMIRGGSIVAAACQLPLTDSLLKPHLHMRHRAAVGATDGTDAVSIVVSEERGRISVALDGRIREDVTAAQLRELLNQLLRTPRTPRNSRKSENSTERENEKASVG